MVKIVPAELKADVVAAYLDGAPSTEVAERFGVGTRSVGRWVRAAGHEMRQPRPAERPAASKRWQAEQAERLAVALDQWGLTAEDVITIPEAWRLYGSRRSARGLSISEMALQVGSSEPADLFTIGRTRYWLYDDILAWVAPALARRWDRAYEARRRDVETRWRRSHARRRPGLAPNRYGYQGIRRMPEGISLACPWGAVARSRGQSWSLGYRATAEEAARLYDRALIALGERPVNFPDDVAATMLLPEPYIGPKTSVTKVMLQIVEKCGPIETDVVLDFLPTWPLQPTRPTDREHARATFYVNAAKKGRVTYVDGGWMLADRAGDYPPARLSGARYDEATKAGVLRAVREGASIGDAAAAHNVGRDTAAFWTWRAGIRAPRSLERFTAQQRSDAVAAYAAGESSKRIGKRIGTTHNTVLQWVRNAGVEVRSSGPRRPLSPSSLTLS